MIAHSGARFAAIAVLAAATGCVSIRSSVRLDAKDAVERVPVAIDVAVRANVVSQYAHGELPNANELAANTRMALLDDLQRNGPYSADVANSAATLNVALTVHVEDSVFPMIPVTYVFPIAAFGVPTHSVVAKVVMEAELVDASKSTLAQAVGSAERRYYAGFYRREHDLSDIIQKAAGIVRRQLAVSNRSVLAKLGPSKTAEPPRLAGDGRAKRLAVLEFRGTLQSELLVTLADQARAAALEGVRTERVAVMTRESLAVMLKEMGKSAVCSEGECEVEIARSIGADLVVSGEVVKLDDVFLATLKLHDTTNGLLVSTSQARGKSAIELVDGTKAAAAFLFK